MCLIFILFDEYENFFTNESFPDYGGWLVLRTGVGLLVEMEHSCWRMKIENAVPGLPCGGDEEVLVVLPAWLRMVFKL